MTKEGQREIKAKGKRMEPEAGRTKIEARKRQTDRNRNDIERAMRRQ